MLNDSEDKHNQQSLKPVKTTLRKCLANKNKDVFNDHLLKLVFARPPLYNYFLPIEERSVSICNKLWKEVANELKPLYGPLELERIKKGYRYHRNLYTRYRCAVSKSGLSSQSSSKMHTPKHMKILCKLDSLINDSKTNSVIAKNTNINSLSINICRTCLIEKPNMESVFTQQLVNNEFVKVSTMISKCTGLEFSEYDNFSNVICDSCVNAVSLAYEFRNKCWNSHKNLMQIQKCVVVVENKSSPVKIRKIDKFINESVVTDKLSDYVDITLDDTVYRGKRYKCRHCDQSYLASHLMIDHLENIHKFSIKPNTWLKCEICQRLFPNQYRLSIHSRQHEDKKIVCQQCGVSVAKGRFAEHFRTHTGEKPFKCDLCDFRAAQTSSLSKHKLTHTGAKPAICHICGRAYRTASHRAVHMRSHSDISPFKCIICKKVFKRNDLLRRHTQTHEPSKMFECEICKRKFSQKGPHRVHMMQHTGRRPHKCNECGKGFIQRHCWRTHMKNHHKIIVQ